MAIRLSASDLPERDAPTIETREPSAERGQELDRLERGVLRAQLQPLGRESGREVIEADAVGQLGGRLAVDRLDPDQRRKALRAAGGALGPRDSVSGHELAALDLGRGDVDVLVGGLGGVDAYEARAAGQELDHALDELALSGLVVVVTGPRLRLASGSALARGPL